MYAEASFCPDGSKVRTQSVEFASTSSRCLTLFYNANGALCKFNIYIRHSDTNALQDVFAVSGGQGDVWKQVKKQFSSKSKYRVRNILMQLK
jgi:hypothetical protein